MCLFLWQPQIDRNEPFLLPVTQMYKKKCAIYLINNHRKCGNNKKYITKTFVSLRGLIKHTTNTIINELFVPKMTQIVF